MVTINIGRKEAIFFGVVILVFVVAGLVIAYNPAPAVADPAVMGHSYNELQPCPSEGQILKMVSGKWACQYDNVGTPVVTPPATYACSVIYQGGPFASSTWAAVDIPAYCLTGASCDYKLQYDRLGTIKTETKEVFQDSTGRLTVTGTNNLNEVNGNTDEYRIISITHDGDTGSALSDDETSIGETSKTKVSVYTRSTNYKTTLSVCY